MSDTLLNPLGFEGFSPGLTPEQQEAFEQKTREHFELCQAFQIAFGTASGKKVLSHLRLMTIENSTWCASLGMEKGVPHGFAREGQNALVRYIEEKIAEALKLGENRKKLLKQSKGKGNDRGE